MYFVILGMSRGRDLDPLVSLLVVILIVQTGWRRDTYQIHTGYPGIQTSGKAMSCAPFWLASSMREMVFAVEASRSSQADSAWMTATRTWVGILELGCIYGMVYSRLL